jgi:hypothetical protein
MQCCPKYANNVWDCKEIRKETVDLLLAFELPLPILFLVLEFGFSADGGRIGSGGCGDCG